MLFLAKLLWTLVLLFLKPTNTLSVKVVKVCMVAVDKDFRIKLHVNKDTRNYKAIASGGASK